MTDDDADKIVAAILASGKCAHGDHDVDTYVNVYYEALDKMAKLKPKKPLPIGDEVIEQAAKRHRERM